VRRKGHVRLLTGGGFYMHEIDPPSQLCLVILRSPHAHARIMAIDLEAARAARAAPSVLHG